jgi:hypothetical protein
MTKWVGAGVFDEAVSEGASDESLARAGRHLDEGAGIVCRQRFFQGGVALNLAVAHPLRWHRRQMLQAGAERVGLSQPFGQGFGPMKTEHLPGTRFGVAFVPKKCFDAGGFVQKRQRAGELRNSGRLMPQRPDCSATIES